MTLAVTVTATGNRYWKYISPFIEALKGFFPPHDVVLFTDSGEEFDAFKVFQPPLGWPRASMMRYHSIMLQESLLSRYDQVLQMDIDLLAVSKINEGEVFSDGITAALHPGYPDTFERRRKSAAFIEGDPPYYQGCLVGGASGEFLKMSKAIVDGIDADDGRGIVAVWHDESHLNRYLADHPPKKVLSPAYCFPIPRCLIHPERWGMDCLPEEFVPKIRHLEKVNDDV